MRSFVLLSALFLAGCEYSLRIPYPTLETPALSGLYQSGPASSSLQPTSPAFGETVTLTLTGLRSDHFHSLYLTYGEGGSGDPDRPSDQYGVSYFRLGTLAPVNEVASISFELRPMMGNDQNGEPFRLSRGQLLTFTLKSQHKQKASVGSMTGGYGSFLIK